MKLEQENKINDALIFLFFVQRTMGNATLSIAESFPVEDNFESLKFVNDNEKNDEEIKNVSKGIAAFWL